MQPTHRNSTSIAQHEKRQTSRHAMEFKHATIKNQSKIYHCYRKGDFNRNDSIGRRDGFLHHEKSC
ncbi:hypothetical protein THIARS_80161 [Thiomonas delicata]|uniref:Uncharacterized protein n=1 Tax=Thiomonas delicata TaxID=364030 RepID=A0A238D8L3_THIDL|nr:hypothetical protein THIARS_80161 [Thiomonas delicata]